MTAEILPFTGITNLDMPPDFVLEAAKGKLEGIVILGYDKEGDEYFAASYADGGTVLWLMERLKAKLLAIPDAN